MRNVNTSLILHVSTLKTTFAANTMFFFSEEAIKEAKNTFLNNMDHCRIYSKEIEAWYIYGYI